MKPIKWIAVGLLAAVAVGAQSQSAPIPQASAQASQPNLDFAAAQALLQQGKYDEAIAQLQAAATKNPGLKGLSHELGTAYYKKGDYIKAIESFKQALAEDADNKEAVQLLGLSYYLSGRPAEAI
ncbi:MAG TPA: tetratricopeptide repeat protein, partial [Terriglobales bacterium]|nr:tetratricopeptide repeat protein [Terriglobales bacterium]